MGIHKTVLLHETVEGLNPSVGGVYIDGTFNAGGHSKLLAKLIGKKGTIIGIDADIKALKKGESEIKKTGVNFFGVNDNFRNLDKALEKLKIEKIDGALFDLGLSSDQLEESGRGFSFKKAEPLLMTFKADPTKKDLTAYDVVNDFEQENLETIIRFYGGEKIAGRIARAIVEAREKSPIKDSKELAEIIYQVVPAKFRKMKIHPATKTFQAIRVVVNDEIESLKEGMEKTLEKLKKGGRMSVISFESLTDGTVKRFMKEKAAEDKLLIITKKPIVPSEEELKENPRSRSAKLRIAEKI
ncbi:MAG: 16S rRNA (cytosine(1402)-N(4))-methyltransferase RsmH [Candidatus Paceibacterota bacterium]